MILSQSKHQRREELTTPNETPQLVRKVPERIPDCKDRGTQHLLPRRIGGMGDRTKEELPLCRRRSCELFAFTLRHAKIGSRPTGVHVEHISRKRVGAAAECPRGRGQHAAWEALLDRSALYGDLLQGSESHRVVWKPVGLPASYVSSFRTQKSSQ